MEEERSSGRKKRSTRSKLCRWTRCSFGVIIVLVIIFVFYSIATIIIDGSTPLDFLWLEVEEDPLSKVINEGPIKKRDNPIKDDQSITNNQDKYLRNHYIIANKSDTKENINLKNQSQIIQIQLSLDENKDYDKVKKDAEKKVKLNHRTSHINKENINKPMIVPTMIMNDQNNLLNNQTNENALRKRSGPPSSMNFNSYYRLPDSAGSRNRRPKLKYPYRVRQSRPRRPLLERNSRVPSSGDYRLRKSSRRRYYDELRNTGPSSVRSYQPSQRYRTRISSRHPSRDHARRGENYSDRNYRRETPYFSTGSNNKYSRKIPNRKLQVNRRAIFRSSDKGRKVPKTYSETRRLSAQSRRHRIKNSGKHHPHDTFRYPSSAGSIQDIIHYLNDEEQNVSKNRPRVPYNNQWPKEHPYITSNYDQNEDDKFFHHTDDNYYFINEDSSFEKEIYVTERYPANIYVSDEDIKYHDTFINNDDANSHQIPYDDSELFNQYNVRTRNRFPDNIQVLPPVHNKPYTPYVPTTSTGYNTGSSEIRPYIPQNKESPMNIVIDIYPSADSSYSANPLKTLMYLSEKLLNYNKQRTPYDEMKKFSRSDHDENEEIVLHINLYSSPKINSYSFSRPHEERNGVSIDIPLTGKLTSMDIYRAIAQKAKISPVASPQTDNLGNQDPQRTKEGLQIQLLDTEKGSEIFNALENILRDLNPHLPQNKKILITK